MIALLPPGPILASRSTPPTKGPRCTPSSKPNSPASSHVKKRKCLRPDLQQSHRAGSGSCQAASDGCAQGAGSSSEVPDGLEKPTPDLAYVATGGRRVKGCRRTVSLDPRKRRTTGMKKGMEESYVEDLANRDGPAHALAFREGAAKRWCRGARRPVMQPRNRQYRGADVLWISGRQHRWRRFREPSADPAGSKNPCMESAGQPAWRKE